MKPAIIQLPDIYRGCRYPAIFFRWKDRNGEAFNLNGWVPLCFAKDFRFNVAVTEPDEGETRILLTKDFTIQLKLGTQAWDFIWISGPTIYPPLLSGMVTVRQSLSIPE